MVNEETEKERKGFIPWRPFPEMTRWEREMERMFEDFLEIRPPMSEGQEQEERDKAGS